jgi:hypothetical protein
VLQVDETGKVTSSGAGTASVIATVTVEGASLSDSYALTVLPDLTLASIKMNGRDLEGFDPVASSYGILLKNAGRLPKVEAAPSRNDILVEIEQVEKIPGTAIIHARDQKSGTEKSYLVNFGLSSVDEEFQGAVPGGQWEWIRENPDHWSLSEFPGSLSITAQEGDIQDASNNAENILVQSANTDWLIESRLEFSRKLVRNGEQGGIVACQDEDNYVKLIYSFAGGGMFGGTQEYIELAIERGGSQFTSARIPASTLALEEEFPSIVLRLQKRGSTYTAHYSVDGQHFELLGSTEADMRDIRAGLIACSGQVAVDPFFAAFLRGQQRVEPEPLKVRYDYFRIQNVN